MKKILALLSGIILAGCAQDIVKMDDPSNQANDLRDVDYDGVIMAREKCQNTLLGASVDNDGCPATNVKIDSQNLDIKFANDSDRIERNSYKVLQNFAQFLNKEKTKFVTIEGHTDKVGSDAYNQALSMRRANAVKTALVKQYHISPERIRTVGLGEKQPLIDADNPQANKVNRRVMAGVSNVKNTTGMRWTVFTPEESK